jgi:hypothetical protein
MDQNEMNVLGKILFTLLAWQYMVDLPLGDVIGLSFVV